VTLAGRLRASARHQLGPTAPLERRLETWVAARPVPEPGAFARFGAGSWVVPPAVVEGAERIEIGDEVLVLEQATLVAGPGARLVVGHRVRLAPFASVHAGRSVVIEDDVTTSDQVTVIDTWGPRRPGGPPAPAGGPVRIGAGTYLGFGSTIGPGVTIGPGAFIGEGAVVLDDVPARAVAYGNPARVVRRWDAAAARWDGPSPVGAPRGSR
jgi:acetyltransferase-like isoleucine patch superfamily enzyme